MSCEVFFPLLCFFFLSCERSTLIPLCEFRHPLFKVVKFTTIYFVNFVDSSLAITGVSILSIPLYLHTPKLPLQLYFYAHVLLKQLFLLDSFSSYLYTVRGLSDDSLTFLRVIT